MPNHLHGIIVIANQPSGGSRTAPTPRKPLGRLVGAFKTVTTRQFNATEGTPGQPLWQRNFYERVIRNADELDRVGEYIVANPLLWETDRENPDSSLNDLRNGLSRSNYQTQGKHDHLCGLTVH